MKAEYDDARVAIQKPFSELVALADSDADMHMYLHDGDEYVDVTRVMSLGPSEYYEARECADYDLSDMNADTIRDSVWSDATSIDYNNTRISAVRMDNYESTDSPCIALFVYSDREDLGSAEDYNEFYGYLSSDLDTKPVDDCIFVSYDESITSVGYQMAAKNMISYIDFDIIDDEPYAEIYVSPYILNDFEALPRYDSETFIDMAKQQKPMFMVYGDELVSSSDVLHVLTQSERIVEPSPESWTTFDKAVATIDSPYTEQKVAAEWNVEPQLLEETKPVTDNEFDDIPF